MINEWIKTDEVHLNIFDHSHSDWHKARAMCLLDHNNWLRSNYMIRNLSVEDHEIFYIAYDTNGNIWNFGGWMEHSDRVVRALNRMYTFPNFRSRKQIRHHQDLLLNLVIPSCEKYLNKQYDLTYISMQMRPTKTVGEQNWWKYFKQGWQQYGPDWKCPDRLIRTCDHEVKDCYQNILYKDNKNYSFEDWNPRSISFEDWHSKFVDI